MLKEESFDPLIFLERQLQLTARLDQGGSILVCGVSGLSAEKKKQVSWVMRTYTSLLSLQLNASKPKLRPRCKS